MRVHSPVLTVLFLPWFYYFTFVGQEAEVQGPQDPAPRDSSHAPEEETQVPMSAIS